MKDIDSLIEELRKTLEEDLVLTDFEDQYVYSFEKIFLNPAYPKPDIIIRAPSLKAENIISDLAEKYNALLLKRGEKFESSLKNDSRILILLDNVKIPKLEKCIEEEKEKKETIKSIYEIHEKGYGTYRNLTLAVKHIFLGKALNKCQQCSTCTGYCTVSPSFKGIETWSSKGRMLITRGIMKGELTYSDKIINTLYACTKCGLCFAQCFQDLDFHEAIMYLRHQIAEINLVPKVFNTAANNIFEHGDPGATPIDKRLLRIKNISNLILPKKADILCWLGCTTATRTPKTAEKLFSILTKLKIRFATLGKNEGCCGYILISTGLWEEAKKVAIEVINKVKKTNAKTLITPCSGCYYTFTRLFPEILDINLPCEILHTSQFFDETINNEGIELKPLNLNVTYHDPCSLGRHSNVYEPPRNILKAIPDLKLIEMQFNRNCARCCGGGAGLWTFNNEVSLEAARTKLKEDLLPINVNILTTACPQCQLNFRFASRMKIFAKNPLKIFDILKIFESAL